MVEARKAVGGQTTSVVGSARQERVESMLSGIASVAVRLFKERGFDDVTVEEIVAATQISVRTFYRYFARKEDLLVVTVRQRAHRVASALRERPQEEPPLASIRKAIEIALASEDPEYIREWSSVVAETPSVLRIVLGANILELNATISDFLASRLNVPPNALIPQTLATAIGAVIQGSQTRWHLEGGDLVGTISGGLGVLEDAMSGEDLVDVRRPRH